MTAFRLVVEAIRRRTFVDRERRTHASRRVAFAIFLLLESLAVNLLILAQVRMH